MLRTNRCRPRVGGLVGAEAHPELDVAVGDLEEEEEEGEMHAHMIVRSVQPFVRGWNGRGDVSLKIAFRLLEQVSRYTNT